MRVLLSSFVLLVGCAAVEDAKMDSDGDGILDEAERSAGTDPESADSDDDGLSDGDEANAGTDPLAADSDGDGYLDPWELTEGSDPMDDQSLIYQGHWPYNPNKDEMEDPGWGERAREGNALPRFAWTDQFGEQVDIYDFAGQGKPVVLDLSGAWCYWCQQVAKLMEGRRNELAGYGWDDLHTNLEAGDFLWVTVLDADVSGDSIDADEVAEWYDTFTNTYVPVLADEQMELTDWINPSGYPTAMILDENLEITTFDKADYTLVLSALAEEFPAAE
jgi:hypothetical protein